MGHPRQDQEADRHHRALAREVGGHRLARGVDRRHQGRAFRHRTLGLRCRHRASSTGLRPCPTGNARVGFQAIGAGMASGGYGYPVTGSIDAGPGGSKPPAWIAIAAQNVLQYRPVGNPTLP